MLLGCRRDVAPPGGAGLQDEATLPTAAVRWATEPSPGMRWNVTNSSGTACDGSVVGECRPTSDPYAEFATGAACASSARARYSAYPDPTRRTGWICTNPVLNECMETQNVDVPFSYKVYATYAECKAAPENNLDSTNLMNACNPPQWSEVPRQDPATAARWYIDVNRNRCDRSFLSSAPFDTLGQCQSALSQCGANGQPSLQFSNPVQSLVYTPVSTKQVPLNPPDRVPVVGQHQIIPGLAGQGYQIY